MDKNVIHFFLARKKCRGQEIPGIIFDDETLVTKEIAQNIYSAYAVLFFDRNIERNAETQKVRDVVMHFTNLYEFADTMSTAGQLVWISKAEKFQDVPQFCGSGGNCKTVLLKRNSLLFPAMSRNRDVKAQNATHIVVTCSS